MDAGPRYLEGTTVGSGRDIIGDNRSIRASVDHELKWSAACNVNRNGEAVTGAAISNHIGRHRFRIDAHAERRHAEHGR